MTLVILNDKIVGVISGTWESQSTWRDALDGAKSTSEHYGYVIASALDMTYSYKEDERMLKEFYTIQSVVKS